MYTGFRRGPVCVFSMVLADGIVVEVSSVGGGRRLVATKPIAAGEMVWKEDLEQEKHYTSTPRNWEWVSSLPKECKDIYCHFMYQTGLRVWHSTLLMR